ncbi:MAG: regulatory protein RecX [Spirochaetales bacterium]|uniref:Regulatory protein RecX n=1 Tax=Candidatus Thalassospirochaeta sargassi TaxID=3119039 RepID=A0AAJ1MII1_9SPIO|nr:regulatory protein RecX [Spirochaetales bacterium]
MDFEVTDIRRTPQGNITAAVFSDGTGVALHPEAALEYSVRIGTEFSPEQIEELQQRSAVYAARDKAVEYLARREHSSKELIMKLRKKDFDAETARAAVELCRERGYVDDRRFAEMWIISRLKKHPEGRSSLAAGLARKGVPREIAAEVLEEKLSPESQDDALARSLAKYLRTRSADPKKIINHLLRRGFRYADIKRHMEGLERYEEETGLEYNEYD